MWNDYSKSYIKNNRTASVSIIAAAFIATLFLSLLCGLFYNVWMYDIDRIEREQGAWQGRITGYIDEDDLSVIRGFANVEKVVLGETLSEGETTADIYFQNSRTIYRDMPLILAELKLPEDAAEYNALLLSRYFIHDPQDSNPPLLMAFYAIILIIICLALVLIIRNSFEVSMSARIHQFGILSSIGATPRQIRTCLLQETAVLCAVPILLGTILGIAITFGAVEAVNHLAADVVGRHPAVFRYHLLVFAPTILTSALTVFFSAWLPARKLSKMTPLEAIRNSSGLHLKKRRHSRILSSIFGIEGELAGNALKAQKKSLRLSTLSLLLSFLGFSLMLCFFTLSGISTRYTYFEGYQDDWDIMATLRHTDLEDFDLTSEVREIPGVQDSIVYQKAEAVSLIPEDVQSRELMAIGGLETVAGEEAGKEGSDYSVLSPIVVMDDESFLTYCSQLGITPSLDGTILRNQIWNSLNSNFRDKNMIPFLQDGLETISLNTVQGVPVELPILSYTTEVPALREEYANYSLVHFMPLSIWKTISGQMNRPEQTTYIRMLAEGEPELGQLNAMEEELVRIAGRSYDLETENRIEERTSNDIMIRGAKIILGAFCGLLAVIGIANVFFNTLSFLRLRKREFAQYLSIGLTPKEMRRMFILEALVIAGKPILITLPLTAAATAYMIRVSHLEPSVFWNEAPILPILLFALIMVLFVFLAYYFGGRRVLNCDLNETLRNDIMV